MRTMPHIVSQTKQAFRTAIMSLLNFVYHPLARTRAPEKWELIQNNRETTIVITQSAAPLYNFIFEIWSKSDSNLTPITWCAFYDHKKLREILLSKRYDRIATLSIFERRGPLKGSPSHRITLPRWIEILLAPSSTTFKLGTIRHINSLNHLEPQLPEQVIRRITRLAKLDFYRTLKIVRGTPFQSLTAQESSVLAEHEIAREVNLIAAREKRTAANVYTSARREFRAIAANPIRPLYAIANRICRFAIWKLFGEINIKGLEEFISVAHSHPTVLVPMHRSHLDYLIVSSALYESKINPPVVAAGVNLRFWPIGTIIRSLGAYFVKRDSRSDRIHALVLRRYVSYLVKRGHLQEFFIEGGRSRSGKMRTPKLGLLNMMVESVRNGARKDLYFVPVAVTYERVVEDRALGEENTGSKKQRENLVNLFRARGALAKSYGDVVLSFGKPISLSNFLQDNQVLFNDNRAVVRELAGRLTLDIRDQVHLSLTSLCCLALLLSPTYGRTNPDLTRLIRKISSILDLISPINGHPSPKTPTLQRFLDSESDDLAFLGETTIIRRDSALSETVYHIPGNQRFTADFYKNSCLHLLFPIAAFATLELCNDSIRIGDIELLYKIFRTSLILPDWITFKDHCTQLKDLLLKEGVLIEDSSRLIFSSRDPGVFLPMALLSPLESIIWCFDTAISLRSSGMVSDQVVITEILSTAIRSTRAGRAVGSITRTEATSHSSLMDSIDSLIDLGVFHYGENEGSRRTIIPADRNNKIIEYVREIRQRIILASISTREKQITS